MMDLFLIKHYFVFVLLFLSLFSLNHLKTLTGRVENWEKIAISFHK